MRTVSGTWRGEGQSANKDILALRQVLVQQRSSQAISYQGCQRPVNHRKLTLITEDADYPYGKHSGDRYFGEWRVSG
jgi:hypothetical protein